MNNVSNWKNVMGSYSNLPSEFKEITDFPDNCVGFVYLIKNRTTNQYYIGKKQLQSIRRVPKTKKELAAAVDKRTSKKKVKTNETDWKTYVGSACTFEKVGLKKVKHYTLVDQVAAGHYIDRYVIRLAFSKSSLTLGEMEEQVKYNVLRDESSLNENILGKFFKKSADECPQVNTFNTKFL